MDNRENKEQGMPETKDTNLGHMFTDFASNTTAHGVSRFANAENSAARFSWFVIWLAVMVAFVYMIVQLILLYQSRPVSTSISLIYEESLTFPGVTICNVNMVRQSATSSNLTGSVRIQNKTMLDDFYKEQFASSLQFNASQVETDDVSANEIKILSNINKLPLEERQKKGYQFDDFVKYCSWGGMNCKKGHLRSHYWRQSWNWKYGNCYTFNGYTRMHGIDLPPLESAGPGKSEGLSLAFDIKRDEYVPSLTVEAGVRVLIENQDMMLFPSENGFTVGPGVAATIFLRKEIIQREDSFGNGSCKKVTASKDSYSIQSCVAYCKSSKLMEKCNCTTLQYAGASGNRECTTFNEDICSKVVKANFTKKIYDCSEMCPPPCSSVNFNQRIAQGQVYPEGHMQVYGFKNTSASVVSNNIVQLSIFFDDQTVKVITTGQYYTFDNLISDIGGQLGLWIGVSAVTCMEFISLIWTLILYIANKRKRISVKIQNN